jgi:hypothetical protein
VNIVFLFPGSEPHEALDTWVMTIGRHTRHEVFLARRPEECAGFDFAFVLTEGKTYPREKVDADIAQLKPPFGVIHNNHNPPAPSLGNYPSFCWTKRAIRDLSAYSPNFLRQPLLPPVVKPRSALPVLVGTFGHIEPKKRTVEMARWAKKNDVPFVACAPNVLTKRYEYYIEGLLHRGCSIRLHEWKHEIEDLAPLLADITHFLFFLPPTKDGTGGSSTSPRYAGLFNRPVIVVDDEDTYREDGFYVYEQLKDIRPDALEFMKPPVYDWSPDAYLDALCAKTTEFWRKK